MVFEAIATLLVRRATVRPVLLVIEDLQWADPTSFDLLGLLARRTSGHRVALVATIRADDRDPILDVTVAGLRRVPGMEDIRLRPLDRVSTARLVAALLPVPPSAELLAEVDRRSGGNPLFIQELAAARRSRDEGGANEAGRVPPDLAGLVLRRVEELNARHRGMVELASSSVRTCRRRSSPMPVAGPSTRRATASRARRGPGSSTRRRATGRRQRAPGGSTTS